MDISETKPAFNVKAVVQQTGIKADTLRAWERRYDMPNPSRTSGGHRLYSTRDIQIVKWLMSRIDEGMTIGLAVDLWHSLKDQGQDPFAIKNQPTSQFVSGEGNLPLDEVRQQWIDRCLNFDETGANAVLNHAFALFSVQVVCEEILLPTLEQTGEDWFENKLTVHQEHFVTNLTLQRLSALVSAAPNPTRHEKIILACPPGEQHTTALRVLNLLLRYHGWDTLYLGANVPASRFEDMIDDVNPKLIILGAQRLKTASSLFELTLHLREAGIPTAYGGRIFNVQPDIQERIPSQFLGDTVTKSLPIIEEILNSGPTIPAAEGPSQETHQLIETFRSRQAVIGTDVWRTLKADGAQYPYIHETNTRMVEGITAALLLGNVDFMDNELEFTRRLMANYKIPPIWTDHYLSAYSQAANWHLGNECRPITDWLEKVNNHS